MKLVSVNGDSTPIIVSHIRNACECAGCKTGDIRLECPQSTLRGDVVGLPDQQASEPLLEIGDEVIILHKTINGAVLPIARMRHSNGEDHYFVIRQLIVAVTNYERRAPTPAKGAELN
jgi:hypothetical protein